MPLQNKNEVIGVIRIEMAMKDDHFSEDDKNNREKLSLTNSNVIYDTQRYRKLNKLIQERSSTSMNLEEALEKVVDVISDSLMSEKCSLYLLSPDSKKLLLTAQHGIEKEDHEKVAKKIKSVKKVKWIVSYDNKKKVKEMYRQNRCFEYCLNYSASNISLGEEIMFFSENLNVSKAMLSSLQKA